MKFPVYVIGHDLLMAVRDQEKARIKSTLGLICSVWGSEVQASICHEGHHFSSFSNGSDDVAEVC